MLDILLAYARRIFQGDPRPTWRRYKSSLVWHDPGSDPPAAEQEVLLVYGHVYENRKTTCMASMGKDGKWRERGKTEPVLHPALAWAATPEAPVITSSTRLPGRLNGWERLGVVATAIYMAWAGLMLFSDYDRARDAREHWPDRSERTFWYLVAVRELSDAEVFGSPPSEKPTSGAFDDLIPKSRTADPLPAKAAPREQDPIVADAPTVRFLVTAPDGARFEATAPKGATEHEVLSKVMGQYLEVRPKWGAILALLFLPPCLAWLGGFGVVRTWKWVAEGFRTDR